MRAREGRLPIPTFCQFRELCERLCQRLVRDLLLAYLQALEEPLIEEPPFLGASQPVGPLHVFGQLQGMVECGVHVLVLDAQLLNALAQTDPLPLDALLLRGEHRLTHLIAVVGRQQLALLLLKAGELQFGVGDLLSRQNSDRFHLATNCRLNRLALLVAQLPRRVVLLDSRLDGRDPMRALLAVAVLAAGTNKVFVLAAVAGRFAVGEAVSAVGAVDGSAQVMEVSPRTFAAIPLARQ